MAERNGSSVERSDSPRLSSLFHQSFLSGLKRNTEQTQDLSKWLAQGRSGSDINWTNPLHSRSNPAIGDTRPTVTNKDSHVVRSLSDSKDALAKLLIGSGPKSVRYASSTASTEIKGADDLSLDNNSDPQNCDSAFDEDIDYSVEETEPVALSSDQTDNDCSKYLIEGTDTPVSVQDEWSWNERDHNFNLSSCYEDCVPLFVDAPAPPGFGSSESIAETGNDPEPDDPVTLILLQLLQQLEQDRCEERERRRKERRHYQELRRSKRKLRRPRQRIMTQNPKDDEAELEEDANLKLFEQMKITMEQGKALGPVIKQDISGCNGLSSMRERLQDITMADLVLPEYTGWLFDQTTLEKVWCVVADMLFCIFENRTSVRPISVIILPGCSVRSLVFKTPASNHSSSKTASGIDRYQIILKESGIDKQYSFSVDTRGDLQKWMTHLKPASNLDDIEQEPATEETRRHSLCGPPPSPKNVEAQTHVTPRYIPSPRNTGRRLSTQDPTADNDSPNSEKKSLNATIQLDSVGEFRRKLRRESDCEVLKPQPMKAMHFQQSESVKKKQGTFKKIRSLGSLDNLFKRKNSKGCESPDSLSLAGSDDGSVSPSAFSTTDFTSGIPSGAGDFGRPQSKRLSRSLDFGKSDKGLSKGLYRTASDLKDRFKRRKSECQVKLIDLNDIRMSGYLQQKFILKWQKLWCVVSGGCLYGFKTQSPSETASVAVALTNCTITYESDSDKRYKKHFVFKISQQNKKSLYLNACDHDDLSHWLQCLQMESSKVQVDVESKDSVETCDSAYSSSISSQSRTSPSTPREGNSPRSRHNSDSTDGHNDTSRRYSSPSWLEYRGDVNGSDADFSSSTDEWCNSTFPMNSRHSIGLPANDFPDHDVALKHVWEKDRSYLFNLVRAKLRSFRRRRETITDTDLPGPNNEGLLLVTDEKHANIKRRKNSASSKVKRASSFNVKSSSVSSADVVTSQKGEADTTSSESKTKRRKALVVKKLAARDIVDPTLSGYLERRSFSEQWMRYWYVLQGGSLFCYLTPDDNVTVDILDLRGYAIETLIDKFRGKRFVLELTHPHITSTHLSVDSRDEMEEWKDCVQGATGQAPSRQATVDQGDTTHDETETYEDKCISVKKKLLEEMLRQKYELEKKQAARQRRSAGGSSNPQTGDLTSEEKLISYATNLRQRRLSTQIKMDTIQKQLQDTPPSNSKRFFNFGGKKKVQQKNNDHLEVQLRELNTKLQEINQDLTSHINQSNGDVFDMNQNRKTNISKTMSEPNDLRSHEDPSLRVNSKPDNGDINRTNSLTLKSSVQKLATKAFSKSVKNKSKTLNGSSRKWDFSDNENGYSSDSQVPANTLQNGDISYENDYDSEGSECFKSDSLTDLTLSHSRGSDKVFSLTGLSLNGGNSSPKARLKGSNSSITSPRSEVHPDTMAEIDAFEDFTKQVLSARMTTS